MEITDIDKDSLFSVVGVCGINGNIIARILMDHGYKVQANDMVNEEDCRFKSSLKDYPDMKIYYGKIPESFFTESDYMILPTALIESKSMLYQKVKKYNIPILTVQDIRDMFEPVHPVICITGTNGKTTTTTLLKHIAYSANLKPCEHNLEGLQGNTADIPSLQARLKGDVNILETGTFGYKGSLYNLAKECKPDVGVITNITPDHLSENSNFLDYARVKGELVELLDQKTLIINNDDPTIQGLLKELNYHGNIISFGVDTEPVRTSTKKCFCGKEIKVEEFIAGVGTYKCDCGIEYKKPDYIATNINDQHNKFTLITPNNEEHVFKLSINGIHNIYNAVGSIIVAHEILNISYDVIAEAVYSFKGVKGRMEKIGTIDGKQIMVDYAHNPAGITTVLKELKNSYSTLVNVITTSSESGMDGDKEILKCAAEYADYIVPASHNSYICAKKALQKGVYTDKIVLPDTMPKGDKEGTLGATIEQVLAGFNKALEIDVNLVVCTGEAAFKYKNELIRE
ncbi:MAG: Mur ligase family protein [Methanosphaera sp.]